MSLLGVMCPSVMEGLELTWLVIASWRLEANQGAWSVSPSASDGEPSGGGRQGQAGREARYWLSMLDKE